MVAARSIFVVVVAQRTIPPRPGIGLTLYRVYSILCAMAWEVNGTDEFADWFGELNGSEQDPIIAVVELLAEHGPKLDRPYADRIKGSKYHNMKELRPRGTAKHFRILFIFDPRREAILLFGRRQERAMGEVVRNGNPRSRATL